MPRTSESANLTRSRQEAFVREWFFESTSHYDARTKRNHDLLGFIDAIACPSDSGGVIAIQFCSAASVSTRVNKILSHPNRHVALRMDWTIVVWGWRPNGTLRQEVIHLAKAHECIADKLGLQQRSPSSAPSVASQERGSRSAQAGRSVSGGR